MVRAYCCFKIVLLLITADTITSLVKNKTVHDVDNNFQNITARRRLHSKSTGLSTSSETDDHKSSSGTEVSLGVSSRSSESSSGSVRRPKPKSSEQRRGWRKYHRKCTPCPDDMRKKWRDRSIAWICGAYQRARRSFKSECMMYYRNCQDGTMFVKIHDHRCKNDTGGELRHGLHFFYEYGRDSQGSGTSSLSSEFHGFSTE